MCLTKSSDVLNCRVFGKDCSKLRWMHIDNTDKVVDYPLQLFNFVNAVDDGEWFLWYAEFEFPAYLAEHAHVFGSIMINGPEAGVDISINNTQFYLPPPYYLVPGYVCDNLIINSNSSTSMNFSYAILSFDPQETMKIKTNVHCIALTNNLNIKK